MNASQLDLPIIANFHGSVGSCPAGAWQAGQRGGNSHKDGVRPVDLFALNSLEIPPFAGCGNSAAHGTTNGCGRLLLDGRPRGSALASPTSCAFDLPVRGWRSGSAPPPPEHLSDVPRGAHRARRARRLMQSVAAAAAAAVGA